jgi:hypothetical protein
VRKVRLCEALCTLSIYKKAGQGHRIAKSSMMEMREEQGERKKVIFYTERKLYYFLFL